MVCEAETEGDPGTPLALESGLGSAEVVLQRLAGLLGQGQGQGGAQGQQDRVAAAWRAVDVDGSGCLDSAELCAAVRQVRRGGVPWGEGWGSGRCWV